MGAMRTITMSTLPIPAPPSTPIARLRWALADGLTVTRRNLAHIRRVPEKLLDVTLSPIMFVLLFAFVFGSAIQVPDGGYGAFLMPGIFVQSVAFLSMTTAVSVANDMQKGIIDRFRSLPMARSAVLVGRTVADLVHMSLGMIVTAACGLIVGWRADEGLLATLGGFGVLLLFGFAMTWLGALVGLIVRTPETASALGFMVLFPITFVANTFVPTEGMPTPLRIMAEWNPISATAAACRLLFGNPGAAYAGDAWPLQNPVLASVGSSLIMLAVFVPLAVHRYRTATGR
jgi:ABC transporter DrrB family efflux protein